MAQERWFPKAGSIPTDPGVYRWFDSNNRILYVGKAKNLRSRLTSYFGKPSTLHERTRRMVASAVRIDWTIVKTEFEALQLEFTWIKQFNPPFNVQFKDDKSYPYLAISMEEEFPRVFITRNRNSGGTKYFGPYTQAWSVRETIDSLLRVFPMRSCTASTFATAKRTNRPCLLADVGKCSAPCVGRITSDEHDKLAKAFASFIASSDNSLIRDFRERMVVASEKQNYEAAAGYRDQIQALEAVRAKSAVVFSDNTSADFVSIAMDGYTAAANLFMVRDGRIRGVKSWVVDLELDRTEAELIAYTLENIYLVEAFDPPPAQIYVETNPDMQDSLETLLSERRAVRVAIKVAKRGEKMNLLETARKNAHHALDSYKLKRSTDFTSRSVALSKLQEALGLDAPPINIECFDVSHLAGTGIVASKVVFIDGRPKKDLYRRYTLETATDDTDAMNQVLARRFKAMVSEESPPSLIVVDGARAQVNAAVGAAHSAGLEKVAIIGIAKRLEELWTSTDEFPVILPRSSAELFLIQHLRDEAHRFAIAHQRLKRTATLTTKLDEIPGLGPKKIALLLRHFGSIKRVAAASIAELTDLPGISSSLAAQIINSLTK